MSHPAVDRLDFLHPLIEQLATLARGYSPLLPEAADEVNAGIAHVLEVLPEETPLRTALVEMQASLRGLRESAAVFRREQTRTALDALDASERGFSQAMHRLSVESEKAKSSLDWVETWGEDDDQPVVRAVVPDRFAAEPKYDERSQFLDFTPNQRLLLGALWGKENVAIEKLKKAVWNMKEAPKQWYDDLKRLKTRTNTKLNSKQYNLEVKQEGETFKLVLIDCNCPAFPCKK